MRALYPRSHRVLTRATVGWCLSFALKRRRDRSMTAIVTGARGFIGQHLCATLTAAGVRVAGVGHGEWPGWADSGLAAWHAGEVDDATLSGAAAALGTVETIYHLAGGSSVGPSLTAPYADFRSTVDTTARLLEWLRVQAPRARLVVVSSAAVYGVTDPGPIREDTPLAPASPYGAHKAMLEALVANRSLCFGLDSAIVRLFSVYGPGLRKQLLWDLCCRCAADAVVKVGGTGDELRDWMHVGDAVALLRAAGLVASPEASVYNGGTGIGTTVRRAVRLVCDTWGNGRAPLFDGSWRPGDPPSLIARMDTAKAIGFTAQTDLPGGIVEYVDWFRRQ